MIRSLALLALAGLALPQVASPEGQPPEEPRVVEVRMVDKSTTEFAYEPAEFTVRPGDVVRFIQAGMQPHNVEFRDVPSGTALGDLRMGPYLLGKGERYEFVVDHRFVAGEYDFVCTPHEFLGMKGKMVVAP